MTDKKLEFPPMPTNLGVLQPKVRTGPKNIPNVLGAPPLSGSVVWTFGAPHPRDVAHHERTHPFRDSAGLELGAIWLCVDRNASLGPYPQLIHLRVGKIDEMIWMAANRTIGRTKPGNVNVAGKVLIQNGISFWQPLEECIWATRAQYTPTTVEGIPVKWKGPTK